KAKCQEAGDGWCTESRSLAGAVHGADGRHSKATIAEGRWRQGRLSTDYRGGVKNPVPRLQDPGRMGWYGETESGRLDEFAKRADGGLQPTELPVIATIAQTKRRERRPALQISGSRTRSRGSAPSAPDRALRQASARG